MKHTLVVSICAVALLFAACTKNSAGISGTTKQVSVNATVTAGSTYSLPLGSYGNRAVITRQASAYTTSTIARSGNSPVYQFASDAKASVAEVVQVAVTDSSHCNRGSHDSTLVTINLNVQ